MLKQSPSRNQRSKRFKVKHALQICLFLTICIWLLYQVKRSYEKKAALEESSGQKSKEVWNGHEILKLGRKDLNPRLQEIAAEFEKHGDEDEELELEAEETKLREGQRRGDGDDEIDGRDQEKAEEEEPEQLEDLIDEDDKEKEEESEGKERVEIDNYIEDVGLLNNKDHSWVKSKSEKAQEEHYKGDDAASSVIHSTHLITSENENTVLRAVEEEQVKSAAKD